MVSADPPLTPASRPIAANHDRALLGIGFKLVSVAVFYCYELPAKRLILRAFAPRSRREMQAAAAPGQPGPA